MKQRLRITLLLGLVLPLAAAACPAVPKPTVHGDFAHYTFALTWQPGFCSGTDPCLASTSPTTLIGLHGLWASRPQTLIDRGISAPQWWTHGCDFYRHSDQAPPLSAATLKRLKAVMPQLRESLLTHEYDKHVQCFGFDPQQFFDAELAMRQRVVDSAFGRYLMHEARGHTVTHRAVVEAFVESFGTDQPQSLQLRCETNAAGQPVLSQLWITLHAEALARFPERGSLMNAPIAQDNCPVSFRVSANLPAAGGGAGPPRASSEAE